MKTQTSKTRIWASSLLLLPLLLFSFTVLQKENMLKKKIIKFQKQLQLN